MGYIFLRRRVGCYRGRRGLLSLVQKPRTIVGFRGKSADFLAPGRGDIDPGRVLSAVKQIVRQIENGHLSIGDAIPQLNSALRHFSQMKWMGTFEDLIAGDGNFERGLRRCVSRAWGTGLTDAVITSEELKAFRTAIIEYGM